MTDAAIARPQDRAGFRPEIHGLRGVSIALVVAYHLWTSGRVSGGVDVFLFVSAFLMVGSFARKGKAFRLVDFLVQRFRRLVPLAAIVIAATLAAGWALLPPTRYQSLLAHGLSSLLYRENWRLISDTVDYMAADPQRLNPFQHFWSLSVQGQIFVLFPLAFLAVLAVHRWFGVPLVRALAVTLGVLTALSFGYALYLVDAAPASAYFNTWARAWEFTGAGLVALLASRFASLTSRGPVAAMPGPPGTDPAASAGLGGSGRVGWLGLSGLSDAARARVSRAVSWAGIGLLLVTGIAWGRGDFPGTAALAPLAAAALVIVAGSRADDPWHAAWWLTRRPVTFVADRAYALYLWHWPVYVFFLVVTSTVNPRTGVAGSLVVIAISLALADVSTRLVERRFHAVPALRRIRYALTTILAFALIALSVAGGVSALVDRQTRATASLPPEERPGARVLTVDPVSEQGVGVPGSASADTGAGAGVPGRGIAPGDTVIVDDWPVPQPFCDDRDGLPGRPELGWCVVIEPDGEQTGEVAVVGDSHAHQWVSALIPLARQEGWRVVAYTRPSCRVGSPSPDAGCLDYTAEAVEWLLRTRPRLRDRHRFDRPRQRHRGGGSGLGAGDRPGRRGRDHRGEHPRQSPLGGRHARMCAALRHRRPALLRPPLGQARRAVAQGRSRRPAEPAVPRLQRLALPTREGVDLPRRDRQHLRLHGRPPPLPRLLGEPRGRLRRHLAHRSRPVGHHDARRGRPWGTLCMCDDAGG